MMKFVLLKLNPLLETESYIQNEIVERNKLYFVHVLQSFCLTVSRKHGIIIRKKFA